MNIEKLKNIKDKFEDLSAKISDPEVIADNKEWTKLVKEHYRYAVRRIRQNSKRY